MKLYWLICIPVLVFCACSAKKAPEGCVYPLGDLLLDTEKIGWNDVFLGKEYSDTVKVYNPTGKAIRLESFNRFPEVQVRRINGTTGEWGMGGIEIPGGVSDTLIVTLYTTDESMLGNYYNVLRFMLDGEVDYSSGLIMDANVLENFDAWNTEERAQAPRLEVDPKEYDFGTIREGEDISIIFRLKNTGGRNLLLRKIETTCGCTAVTPGKRVIGPGKTMDFKIVFRSAGKNGMQRKTITLFCNDPQQPIVKFVIKGKIN